MCEIYVKWEVRKIRVICGKYEETALSNKRKHKTLEIILNSKLKM
jgi:hypothetical protein